VIRIQHLRKRKRRKKMGRKVVKTMTMTTKTIIVVPLKKTLHKIAMARKT
jgi:hypothetical protein